MTVFLVFLVIIAFCIGFACGQIEPATTAARAAHWERECRDARKQLAQADSELFFATGNRRPLPPPEPGGVEEFYRTQYGDEGAW